MTSATDRLLEAWAPIADLSACSGLVSWDQETQMPPAGGSQRAALRGTLAALRHSLLVDPALGDALAAVEDEAEPGSVAAAHAREARRHVERARSVPESLVRELAVLTAEAHEAWKAARASDDFAAFAPVLERLVELSKRRAACYPGDGPLYDRLLDLYEPGATEAELAPLFDDLEATLGPWIRAVAELEPVDESPAMGAFDPDVQLAFAREVAEAIGFDFEAGRIDRAAHPFCSGFGPRDVRLTWRWLDDDFRSALYGVMHEAGHGLYEQGLPREWARTPIGGAVSLGVHESQSRLWENLVGRSRGFWEWALPRFHARFPAKRDVDGDAMFRALNTVRPSLIRVEADEGTYDLHVAVRFRIERALFAGEVAVAELPAVWDEAYQAALGVHAPSVADGVLQDVHWSSGAFGYFPTYTLGNLLTCQLFERAEETLGPLEPRFAEGEFAPLLGWLREHVHVHGSRYTAPELIERATGAPLGTEAYLRRRRRSLRAVYGPSFGA